MRPISRRLRSTDLLTIGTAAVVALLATVALMAPAQTLAAPGVWTVTAAPLTLDQDVPTQVSLTVTAVGGTTIGCVRFKIPSDFEVVDAQGPAPWTLDPIVTGPPAQVVFHVTKDPQRLTKGASAVFKITVIATKVSAGTWTASAYEKFDPSSKAAGPDIGLGGFVVVPTPTPRPTPAPTPRPTPAPTPRRTAAPTATTAPTSPPGGQPAGTPHATSVTSAPGSVEPSVSPSPSATEPGPSLGPAATPGAPIGGVSVPSPPPPPPAGPTRTTSWATVPAGEARGSVSPAAIAGLLGSLGVFEWLVPSVLLGLPGLLLIVTVVAQTSGALAWIPVVRRKLGTDDARTRP